MYQSYRQQTQSVSTPSRSGSAIGGILGAIGGALLAPLTAGTSMAIGLGAGASLGAGIGSAFGSLASDTTQVPVAGGGYGATDMGAMQTPPAPTVYPLPMEDPRAYKQRLSQLFRGDELSESKNYYGA